MPVDDAQRLDQRYSELAGYLKACWAYEQFYRRLHRSLPESADLSQAAGFEATYADLKQLAAELGSLEPEAFTARSRELEERLRREASQLFVQDSKLRPADLRRFLGRVRRLDEEFLFELLRFYVIASQGAAWKPDLTDKIDLLLSRLAQEVSGPLLTQDQVRLEAYLVNLWRLTKFQSPQRAVLGALRGEISEVAGQLEAIESLEALEAAGMIAAYRKFKHGLGALFLEPSLSPEILHTNAALGRKVQELYNEEEWAIAAGFSRLARLGPSAGVGDALSIEIESLRRDLERLEEGRRYDDVRIGAVRQLRRQADAILPQVDQPEEASAEPEEVAIPPEPAEPEVPTIGSLGEGLQQKLFGQLESLLAASMSIDEAEDVLQDPGLPLSLERREVEAFLSLRDDASADPELDRLLLTGASLRLRLTILRDHLEAGASGAAELEAGIGLDLAEMIMRRLEGEIEELEKSGPTALSAELRFVRMLMMRDYATVWLELNGST